MPYALAPLVRVHPKKPRRLLGFDQSPHSFIVLDVGDRTQPMSGLALAWFDVAPVDANVDVLSDHKNDMLTGAARASLARAFPGIGAGRFQAEVFAGLRPRLRPEVSGDVVCYLGPSSDPVLDREPGPPRPHSKRWFDNADRANAALAGSLSSDGSFTWADGGDTLTFNIVSNQIRVAATSFEDSAYANTGADADTDSTYGEITLVSFTNPGTGSVSVYAFASINATRTSGHAFNVNTAPERAINAILGDVTVASDATSTTSGRLRMIVNGTSVSAEVNGTVVLGPVSSATETTGAGFRRSGIRGGWADDNEAYVIDFDNFVGGDLTSHVRLLSMTGVG